MSKVNFEAFCKLCGKVVVLQVNEEDLDEYFNTPRNERRLVQDIFHYLTPEERELLISNTCDDCFKKTTSLFDLFFEGDEEEEVDENDN